jgi:hypothetical protein
MQPAFTSPANMRAFGAPAPVMDAPLRVRAWTGRSALSCVTATSRPALATAGAPKTRVSAMRGLTRRTALARPARACLKPRHPGSSIE